MTTDRDARAEAFRALHVAGDPLVLFNIWDAGSAAAVARTGARALATGSWSVAAAQGYADGEQMPLELVLGTLRRIVAAVELPVSIDLEAGYGDPGGAVAGAVTAGAIGCNLEDGMGDGRFYDIADQGRRLDEARAGTGGKPFFLNARIDLFLAAAPADRNQALLEQAIERALAYAEAGADGIFVPALADEALIGRLCEACPKPVNIMAAPGGPPLRRLAELGVARVSHGPGPYRLMMQALEEAARQALA